jgi:hypothetical protein
MVYKVQVMSDEEAERYNKWQNDLDNVCDRIKICICWSICILVFVYLIVTIVVMVIDFKELNGE